MSTYLFPGQGSQIKGMGANLFDEFPELVRNADEILGYSIKSLCLEDPNQQLNLTQYTQPALYVVNSLLFYNKKQLPDFVAGHSLGEYNALLAAEVYSFETGLKLVKKRGELMSQASGGAMLAIIGLNPEAIKECLMQHNLMNVCIANYNSYTQTIISGLKDDIERAQLLLEQAGAMLTIPLKVSGAFHSTYMQNAQMQFHEFLQNFEFVSPRIPVIANITAKPYLVSDIANNLALQITHPVRWTEGISYLLNLGEEVFEEIGPGTVLTGLLKKIKNGQ